MKNTIIAQVDYIRSTTASKTRQNIIRTKLINCRYLLTRFRNTRKNSDQFSYILSRQNAIHSLEPTIKKCLTTADLLLHEARAAKYYWETVRIICKEEDFMELYRQMAVDSVIIPLFSRKNTPQNGGKIISKIQERFQKRYVYQGELIALSSIMKKEAFSLRAAILNNEEWKPFRFQWGNSMRTRLMSEIKKKKGEDKISPQNIRKSSLVLSI